MTDLNRGINDITVTINEHIDKVVNNTIKSLANSSMEELYYLHQNTTNEDLKKLIERIVI